MAHPALCGWSVRWWTEKAVGLLLRFDSSNGSRKQLLRKGRIVNSPRVNESFVSRRTWINRSLVVLACLSIAAAAAAQNPSTVGQWTALFNWPDTAIHGIMLPNGKVMTFGDTGHAPVLWNPLT